MKTFDVNELPDEKKAMYYQVFFGESSGAYTPLQREKMAKQILQMISIEGIEVATGRVIAKMVEETPDMPQLAIDGFYNAVLWLHRLNSESN